jgi:hypothetical protein
MSVLGLNSINSRAALFNQGEIPEEGGFFIGFSDNLECAETKGRRT